MTRTKFLIVLAMFACSTLTGCSVWDWMFGSEPEPQPNNANAGNENTGGIVPAANNTAVTNMMSGAYIVAPDPMTPFVGRPGIDENMSATPIRVGVISFAGALATSDDAGSRSVLLRCFKEKHGANTVEVDISKFSGYFKDTESLENVFKDKTTGHAFRTFVARFAGLEAQCHVIGFAYKGVLGIYSVVPDKAAFTNSEVTPVLYEATFTTPADLYAKLNLYTPAWRSVLHYLHPNMMMTTDYTVLVAPYFSAFENATEADFGTYSFETALATEQNRNPASYIGGTLVSSLADALGRWNSKRQAWALDQLTAFETKVKSDMVSTNESLTEELDALAAKFAGIEAAEAKVADIRSYLQTRAPASSTPSWGGGQPATQPSTTPGWGNQPASQPATQPSTTPGWGNQPASQPANQPSSAPGWGNQPANQPAANEPANPPANEPASQPTNRPAWGR
ncbi:MAG: hypothetical protein NUW37_11900 [Planctomycetes bacterium]|nr:hypothetical protein [Planctomycetota bacterium]